MIELIRKKAVTEEIDYNFLLSCLSGYSNPRDKISRLIRAGDIIRVKKGLYIFGPKYAVHPYSRETLANLIFGPSYISLEYALYFHGMIPERIETVTSVTNKRNKLFKTPLGNFSYTYISPNKYAEGITQVSLDDSHNILIASREKALTDKVYFSHGIRSLSGMQKYLFEDLRIDEGDFKNLGVKALKKLSNIYENAAVKLLYELRRQMK